MMDCLCVVNVNVNVIGQRDTNLNSRGFCGGTGVIPTETRKRVSYIMMNVSEEGSGDDCTPSNVLFTSDALDNADGTMTARYRINGGSWQDYSEIPYVGAYSLAKDFLLELHWNDRRLFTDSGGGDAAFLFDYGDIGFSGAYERLEDNTNMVKEIVDPSAKITIDFQVTSRDEYDIVWMLFGQDITVHSCAIVRFAGT